MQGVGKTLLKYISDLGKINHIVIDTGKRLKDLVKFSLAKQASAGTALGNVYLFK